MFLVFFKEQQVTPYVSSSLDELTATNYVSSLFDE